MLARPEDQGIDKDTINNLAQQREFNRKQQLSNLSKGLSENFDDVVKIAEEKGSKATDLLKKIKGVADEKKVPINGVMQDVINELAKKRAEFGKVAGNIGGKLKAVPVIGGLAALGSALQSGDAAAAGLDQVVPGGIEEIGTAPGEAEMARQQQEYNDNLKRNYLKTLAGQGILK